MDAFSFNCFVKCGAPTWRELVRATGILGTPLLEITTSVSRPAARGETLQIHSSIDEGRIKTIAVCADLKALCG